MQTARYRAEDLIAFGQAILARPGFASGFACLCRHGRQVGFIMKMQVGLQTRHMLRFNSVLNTIDKLGCFRSQ